MKIKVVRASTNAWYDELINEIFYVFTIPNNPLFFFTVGLFFFPEDIEVLKYSNAEAAMPQISGIGEA